VLQFFAENSCGYSNSNGTMEHEQLLPQAQWSVQVETASSWGAHADTLSIGGFAFSQQAGQQGWDSPCGGKSRCGL
jgi:hypothetical protein